MRSRYTAFVAQDWAYLDRTQAKQDKEPPTTDIEWQGLEVLATHGGATDDTQGTVEFIARYRHQGRPAVLHEISRFGRQEGNWTYLDGEFPKVARPAKTGRNDPCPCSSGKKYKKCCAHE
jgi:SEC-C motif-containing protein